MTVAKQVFNFNAPLVCTSQRTSANLTQIILIIFYWWNLLQLDCPFAFPKEKYSITDYSMNVIILFWAPDSHKTLDSPSKMVRCAVGITIIISAFRLLLSFIPAFIVVMIVRLISAHPWSNYLTQYSKKKDIQPLSAFICAYTYFFHSFVYCIYQALLSRAEYSTGAEYCRSS